MLTISLKLNNQVLVIMAKFEYLAPTYLVESAKSLR